MKWDTAKIGDNCEVTSSRRIFYSEYVKSGIPFYRSKEIIQSFYGQSIDEPLYISEEKYKQIAEKYGVPRAGDMLLTSVGTIGVPYLLKETDCFYFKDGNLTWFRNFSEKLSSRYLYYWIQSPQGKGVLFNSTIGSSQKALTISMLKEISIPLPPISVQNRIIDILSAYDDLIENNQKQIKLLEEAAMRLYKEWFVKLRFPGYESTNIVDGVPDGWLCSKTKDFIRFKYGKALKADDRKDGKYPVYGSSGIVGYHNEFLVEAPVVIVGRKGNVGSVYISFVNAYPIDTVYYVESNISIYYTYFNLLTRTFLNNDSAVPGLNRDYAESMEMLCPSRYLQNEFDNKVSILFDMQFKLQHQIDLLKQARDKLIPKLMNGEIEV
ncbi:MAG TPA: restriction endonuclease subunit S [Pseudobacteroides sp.]|nr:restriction endonuclease subunit S [Pseudobacteroides sp.]